MFVVIAMTTFMDHQQSTVIIDGERPLSGTLSFSMESYLSLVQHHYQHHCQLYPQISFSPPALELFSITIRGKLQLCVKCYQHHSWHRYSNTKLLHIQWQPSQFLKHLFVTFVTFVAPPNPHTYKMLCVKFLRSLTQICGYNELC